MKQEEKKSVKVTEQVFDTVKFMVKGGASISQCSKAVGVCPATISFIKRAETFEEYRELMYRNSGGYKKRLKKEAEAKPVVEEKKEEKVEPPVKAEPQVVEHRITLVANQYMTEQLQKQTELLTLINNKLTLMCEELGCFKDERIERVGG